MRQHATVDATDDELTRLELVRLGAPFVVDSVALTRRTDTGVPPTLQECGQALTRIIHISDAVKYWAGDVLNLAGTLFGEDASQLLDPDLLDEKESREWQRVAEKVDPVTRAHAPSWEHAQAVAKLATPQQVEWLDKARGEDWSARKLASELAQFGAKGKTQMRFWLVVECGTEARRDKLAGQLEAQGFSIKKQEALRKVPKPKKAKAAATAQRKLLKGAKPKKPARRGPVTAQRKRKGAPKMNTRRRLPR